MCVITPSMLKAPTVHLLVPSNETLRGLEPFFQNYLEPSKTRELNFVERFKALFMGNCPKRLESRNRSGTLQDPPKILLNTLLGPSGMEPFRWERLDGTFIFSKPCFYLTNSVWQWLKSLNLQGCHPTSVNNVLICFVCLLGTWMKMVEDGRAGI